ncbi:MAG: spermidine/putrescine ABC transporter ATP-binding protein [Candidatus Rokubacteria bacterium 13_1_20CM_2_70_7]|nr:MAG: spermidine/putrescine ABC transporter ATP-binding protein [Candidatus Rokubacteria bacterium 13_1_20CM_2_70_7]
MRVIGRLRFRLSKHFGAKNVLDDFALEVRGGEFVTFLGPSGCGKSTALNLLAGLLAPSAGEIWLEDQRIDALPPERRGFGMVFQNYALFPHLSVFDNVAFGLDVRRLPRTDIAERVRRMLELVRLEGLAARYPGQLSGGQQQRVAIARALVIEPRVLLLDEPLSNLDAKLRLEMRAEIKRLHGGLGLTSIYVTHDQTEALSLSDRIVVMREGRVMQVGTPAEIHDRPQNLFVADFVGYRNMFPLTVTTSGVDGRVTGEGAGLTLCGRSVIPFAVGARVLAAVRPEDASLTADPPGLNVLQGQVRLIEYQGREYDVEVGLESGATVKARLPRAVPVGSAVNLALDAERVVILPPDGTVAA